MQSSSALRAWPHFVPRLELDAELKAMDERINEACKRIDKTEAYGAKLRSRLDEHQGEQRDEVGTRLSEAEERVAHEVAALRLELQRGLEDVRANTAAEAAVRERMITAHQSLFDQLGRDIAALDRQIKHLDMTVRAVPTTFATKAEAHESRQKATNDGAEMFRELKEEIAKVERDRPTHQFVRDLHGELHSKHEDLHLSATLAATSLDGLKTEFSKLERRQVHLESDKGSVVTLATAVADLGRQMRSAREEQKSLRSQVSQEHEALRRTVFGFQDSARDLRGAMELLTALDRAGAELRERCERSEKDFASLATREHSHWEASQGALEAQRRDHSTLEALCRSLQTELGKHIEGTKEKTEQLRQHNVGLCFEQMDKALGLHKSLVEMERGHRDLQDAVRSVHLPKV